MMIKSFKRSDLQNLEHSHTEIRQLYAARDESYRTLQFTVRAAKHRCAADVQAAADEVEKGDEALSRIGRAE